MSSNFDFLQGNEDSMGYFRAANFLEQEYAIGNYASELTSARKIAENVVKFILDQNYMDNDATFAQNLKAVKYHHLLNQQLVDLLYAIKQPGNEASHTLEQYNKQDGVAALQQVIQLMYWFAKTYCDYEGEIQPFVEPAQRSLYTTSERHMIYSLSGDNSDGNWPRYTGLEKVAEITAVRILAELGDIRRFSNPNKINAFVGIDPGRYQSGEKDSNLRISKHGNAVARKILYRAIGQIDLAAKTSPCHIADYYERKKQFSQTKGFKKIAIASIQKLLRTVYVLIITDQMYDYNVANNNQKDFCRN